MMTKIINESRKRPNIGKLVLLYNDGSEKEINVEDISKQDFSNVNGILDWCNLIMDPVDYVRLSKENPNATYTDLVNINLNEDINDNYDFVVNVDMDKLDKYRHEHPICEYCGKELTPEEIKTCHINSVGNGVCFDCRYADELNEGKTSTPSEFLKRDYEKLKNDPMIGAKEHWSDTYYNEVEEYGKELKENELEESKKYNVYVTYGEDGVYNTKLVDTVDSKEQAIDRVTELQAETGCGASYEEVEFSDITNILNEMTLLEDYEEGISPQKQKFIDYCKDKIIEDMGTLEIDEEDYTIIMHTDRIREFKDLRIIADFEDPDFDVLMAIDKNNKIVINSRMIDPNGYAATMEFDQIDKAYYDMLLKYWNDIYMDEMIEED